MAAGEAADVRRGEGLWKGVVFVTVWEGVGQVEVGLRKAFSGGRCPQPCNDGRLVVFDEASMNWELGVRDLCSQLFCRDCFWEPIMCMDCCDVIRLTSLGACVLLL